MMVIIIVQSSFLHSNYQERNKFNNASKKYKTEKNMFINTRSSIWGPFDNKKTFKLVN